ncbi:MAG: carboxypeptidase regulatory-like domain-containing protein [Sedimentisphaerales bacterium]|nr:carboxypeptidase regulatory-like domain-containing protein [Sedimentisphaerales bacterium]
MMANKIAGIAVFWSVVFCLFSTEVFAVNGDMGGGDGSEASPWLIQDFTDFQEFADDSDYWDDYSRLETDIDLTGITYTDAVIAPDISASSGFQGVAFTGSYDGNGHTILNLTISGVISNNWYLGLFGKIAVNSSISNLGIVNCDISGKEGSYWVGGMVGYIDGGSLNNCYVTGNISGDYRVGGLIGGQWGGEINSCCVFTNVNSGSNSEDIGALMGWNDCSSTSNCYSKGSVTAGDSSHRIGGLMGTNIGTVTNCYSATSVHGGTDSSDIGGLLGDNRDSVVDSFWDIDISGMQTSDGGSGKTTSQMKQQATFTNWDFVNVWDITENATYPFLREFGPPPSVTIRGTVYDAATADNPLPDVTVSAQGKQTTTNALGEYEITGLSPGDIMVIASKVSYQSQSQTKDATQVGKTYTIDFQLIPEGITVIDSGFRPSVHGFHFKNPNIFGVGFCKGFTYTSLLCYFLPVDIPPDKIWPTYSVWAKAIETSHILTTTISSPGLWELLFTYSSGGGIWLEENVSFIKTCLSGGIPCPITLAPAEIGLCHSVLAYKIVERSSLNVKVFEIYVYNSNDDPPDAGKTCITVTCQDDNWSASNCSYGSYTRFIADFLGTNIANIKASVVSLYLDFVLNSPATIEITNPCGVVFDKDSSEVNGMYYRVFDCDDDGHEEQVAIFLSPKEGPYSVKVVPDPCAEPTDTYTLEEYKFGEKTVLAENVEIQDVPDEPYQSIVVYPTIDCKQALALMDYELVEEERIGRTEFEYTFRMWAANSWVRDLKDVTVRLVSDPNNVTVLDDTVGFSLISAGAEVLSDDTFKIRIDRSMEGSESDIVWEVCDCKMKRRSDFNDDWNVDLQDFAVFAQMWLNTGTDMPQDTYPDSIVDLKDLFIFSEEWLK